MESSLCCQAPRGFLVLCPWQGQPSGCGSCPSASPQGGSSRDSSEGRISPFDTACTNVLQKLCPLAFFLPFFSEEKNLVCLKLTLSTLYKFLIHCNCEQQRGELTASSSSNLLGKVFLCGDTELIPEHSCCGRVHWGKLRALLPESLAASSGTRCYFSSHSN